MGRPPMKRLRRHGKAGTACAVGAWTATAGLILLAGVLLTRGWEALDAGFFLSAPSPDPDRAGIGPALAGTFWLALLTVAIALPVGVGAAIYLEEYAPRGRWATIGESVVGSLAGVPSVVYGVAGLAVYVRAVGTGRSLLAGGLTLATLALPVVIATSREALRGVPDGLRRAAYGLGATRWQVVRHQVLPAAAPGIATGSCLAFTRAVGEAAPLLVIGAASFVTFAPQGPGDPLVSLPTRIFAWSAHPQPEFGALAAGAAIALILLLLAANLAVLALRRRMRMALP